ncbi:rhodanese-like domain-containing protein [Clostridium ihumii]|uniref:rhodanese-like domain-containing protein n=1 Tax=Clostridium ihumii TaxID=1470356 RepID=UPI0005574875|nr:rhodanese-like domain-containing protein [Clostridium ihumii]
MKKVLAIVLTVGMTFSLVACGNNKEENKINSNEKNLDNKDKSAYKNISIEEAKKMIEEGKFQLILDVRGEDEFKEGHIKDAKVIPDSELENRLSEIEEYKDKNVLVYCRSGKRSTKASEILANNEFKNVYHMHEGMIKWDGDIIK